MRPSGNFFDFLFDNFVSALASTVFHQGLSYLMYRYIWTMARFYQLLMNIPHIMRPPGNIFDFFLNFVSALVPVILPLGLSCLIYRYIWTMAWIYWLLMNIPSIMRSSGNFFDFLFENFVSVLAPAILHLGLSYFIYRCIWTMARIYQLLMAHPINNAPLRQLFRFLFDNIVSAVAPAIHGIFHWLSPCLVWGCILGTPKSLYIIIIIWFIMCSVYYPNANYFPTDCILLSA